MKPGAVFTGSRLRWSVPVGIAAVAVGASLALPALSAGADPALPKVSAQQLLSRALSSDVQNLSGTVRTHADLGIPALPGDVRSSDLSSLITGDGTLRVAKSGDDKQRLSVLGSSSEKTFVHNGRTMWSYDSGERKAVRTTLPAGTHQRPAKQSSTSPDEAAKRILAEVSKDSTVSVGRAAHVAGRDAYLLVVKPKSSESLVGSVQVPVDAKTWLPLGLSVLPRGSADPAIDARFSDISYAKPAASTFQFTPPAGTKVTTKTANAGEHGHGKAAKDKAAKQRMRQGDQRPSWTKVVQLGDVSGANGKAGAYVKQLRGAGTRVSGDFGHGTLVRSRLVTVLILDDGRAFAGAVTPAAVEHAAAKA